MSTAIAAFGITLGRGNADGPPETFSAVAEVTKVEAPQLKQDAPDATAHSFTSTFTVTGSSTTMTVAATALLPVGTVIRLASTVTLPAGTAANTDYYIVTRGTTTATIALTPAGTPITFGDAGAGTHTLTAGRGWKENVPTLRDPGSLTLDINFVPANATQSGTAGIILDLKNGTLRNWKLTFPGPTVMGPFAAFVADFKPSAPVDGKLSASVTLKLSGDPSAA